MKDLRIAKEHHDNLERAFEQEKVKVKKLEDQLGQFREELLVRAEWGRQQSALRWP